MDSVAVEYAVVVVVWNDAWAELDDAHPELIHHGPKPQVTVGFLIRSDDVGVTLACEYDLDDESDLRSTMFIPRGMVVSEKVVVDGPAQ